MVRTKGPLLSTSASGSIAKTLTASNWKGRSYMKKLSIPTNNQQAPQLGIRSAMSVLSKDWTLLSTPDQASWEPLARATTISPFDAYIAQNLMRTANSQGASQAYPPTLTVNIHNVTIIGSQIHNRFVNLVLDDSGPPEPWIGYLYRSTSTGFTPGPSNLTKCFKTNNTWPTWYVEDRPPEMTTYYYRSGASNYTGQLVISAIEWQVDF